MTISNAFKSKLYSYAINRLNAAPYRNGWLKVPVCPFCGKELKYGINLNLYRTNCFRCGYHSNPAQMVMDIENFDTYAELIKFLNNGEFTEHTFKEVWEPPKGSKSSIELPEGFRLLTFGSSQISRTILNYVTKRGFKPEDLAKYGWGYCSSGKLMGYLIIPYFYGGHLVYYNARRVIGDGPRYSNPTSESLGKGKSQIIYNYDALSMYESIYICEGAINAMTMGERAIATMGKHASAYQINELIKAPVKRYILLLDPDAKDKSINLALKLVQYKKVKVVFLPEGKDCNDLSRNGTLKYVYNTRYQDYKQLIQLKNSL